MISWKKKKMRINKYIAKSGIASRRAADKLILDGKIKVNGETILTPGLDIKDNDIVKFNGQIIKPIEEKYYILLNKPVGYVCSNYSQYNEKIIYELIDIDTKLFSVGRLDKDSRGLIILTNDGDIYNNIIHPKSEIFKTYIVKLDKDFNYNHKPLFEQGIDIGDYITNPSKIRIISNRLIEIKINEGKNRQIRRMFEALNYEVIDLNRISIGEITLTDLDLGEYRYLTKEELEYLRSL